MCRFPDRHHFGAIFWSHLLEPVLSRRPITLGSAIQDVLSYRGEMNDDGILMPVSIGELMAGMAVVAYWRNLGDAWTALEY